MLVGSLTKARLSGFPFVMSLIESFLVRLLKVRGIHWRMRVCMGECSVCVCVEMRVILVYSLALRNVGMSVYYVPCCINKSTGRAGPEHSGSPVGGLCGVRGVRGVSLSSPLLSSPLSPPPLLPSPLLYAVCGVNCHKACRARLAVECRKRTKSISHETPPSLQARSYSFPPPSNAPVNLQNTGEDAHTHTQCFLWAPGLE